MRRRLRREFIGEFHQLGETPVERISGRDASPYSAMLSVPGPRSMARRYSRAITTETD
jgi:hypothetical protein